MGEKVHGPSKPELFQRVNKRTGRYKQETTVPVRVAAAESVSTGKGNNLLIIETGILLRHS
jgi:hypothetical protein